MTAIRNYRDLDVWQTGMKLLLIVYDIASQLPQIERFELASQMRRAALSIPSNVAEGQAYGPSARTYTMSESHLGRWQSCIRIWRPSCESDT